MAEDETQSADQRDADQVDERDESRDTEDLGDKGKRALEREREARKKADDELKELRKKVEAAEAEAKKRNDEKAKEDGRYQDLLKEREKELEDIRASIAQRDFADLKRRIAAEEGLTDSWATRIQGDDEDALRADAKAIAKDLKTREPSDTDAGDRTKPGQKRPDKKEFANQARWGIR